MKESKVYLYFLKRNLIFILLPVVLALTLSFYFFSREETLNKISQTFKLVYAVDNIDTVFALTDEAVAELRAYDFGFPASDAKITIYKSAPLLVNTEVTSTQREKGYELSIKASQYLTSNFQVVDFGTPSVTVVEPNLFKYLVSGLAAGFLIGLIASLIREYFRNY